MPEAEAKLGQAAIEFLEAAGEAAEETARTADRADPLDEVETDVFNLGEFEPVVDERDLVELKRRLRQERLLPATLVELVNLARQVAAALLEL
ncbi:MAG: hypothetical protein WBD63_12335 [Phycisphaerae bacterium]|nr:hypothetical protein [Phycisphaerae bacterium]